MRTANEKRVTVVDKCIQQKRAKAHREISRRIKLPIQEYQT